MNDRPARKATLSEHAREVIDHWVAKFPEGRQRSAVIEALRVVQHDNKGYLTPELMDAVADYLDLPVIQVYEKYAEDEGGLQFFFIFFNTTGSADSSPS